MQARINEQGIIKIISSCSLFFFFYFMKTFMLINKYVTNCEKKKEFNINIDIG